MVFDQDKAGELPSKIDRVNRKVMEFVRDFPGGSQARRLGEEMLQVVRKKKEADAEHKPPFTYAAKKDAERLRMMQEFATMQCCHCYEWGHQQMICPKRLAAAAAAALQQGQQMKPPATVSANSAQMSATPKLGSAQVPPRREEGRAETQLGHNWAIWAGIGP
jgi:hypothetical protein